MSAYSLELKGLETGCWMIKNKMELQIEDVEGEME
jgi:hypothetical protein